MSRVTVVTPTDEFAQRVVEALGPGAEEYVVRWWDEPLLTEPSLAAGAIAAEHPTVVLFGGDDIDLALHVGEMVQAQRPGSGSVLVAEPTPDLYARAMRSGFGDILPPDASLKTIAERVSEALSKADRIAHVTRERRPGKLGSVVTMLEPKGGAGKTSIVANLAVVLAERYPGEVALVDLDLQFGDLTDVLLLKPRYTMADVARAGATLDSTALKAFLTRREGLFVLAAPGEPELADDITQAHVSEVIDMLRPDFRWVLVDTAGGLTEHTLAAVEQSTDIILLSSLDVLANKSMRKTMKILDNLGVILPRRHLVLNRADSKVGLDRTEAIMELGMRRAVEIPSSRAMPTSLNRGQPVVETQPRATISRRIADLAEELIAAQAATEEWSS